ncbi:MAG: sel1 repeat family protein [Robiginitomaculum sp.]|nr:sel1 repeat family protein [Robiginitomaculum sp.]
MKAIKIWTSAAEAGSAKAQTNLAKMYVNAQGTSQSKEKALYWINKALTQDYAPAFSVTAELHQKGIFYPADWQKAYEFYERASELGEGRGAYFIGMAKEDWDDMEAAIKFYKLAAQRGFPDAQAKLGLMYERGIGVKIDLNKSMQWHLKAAQQDFPFSIYTVGVNYKNGNGVPKSLALANNWFKRGARLGDGACLMSLGEPSRKQIKTDIFALAKSKAESGNAKAQYKLAGLYSTGQGTEKSVSIAKYWLEKSADQNFSKAIFDLASYYGSASSYDAQKSKMLYLKLAKNLQEPRDVIARAINAYESGDYGLAFFLALPYADGGNKYAQSIIGKMYQWGRGAAQSKDKALTYYKKAGDQGLAGAQYSAAYIHQYDNDHMYAARSWYKLAAAQDHPDALVALGHFYRNGVGVDKNRDEAIRLYTKAESLGHEGAANYKHLTQQEKWDEQRRAQARAVQAAKARTYYYPPKKRNKWSFSNMLADAVSNSYNNSGTASYNSASSSYRGYASASTYSSNSSSGTRSAYATYKAPAKVSPYEYRYKSAWIVDGPKY